MVPGLRLNEGGQSSAGAAIDHLLLNLHPASASKTMWQASSLSTSPAGIGYGLRQIIGI